MKKRILVILVLLFGKLSAQTTEGQFNFNQLELKHIKGVQGLEFNYGVGGNNGKYLQFMYDIYWRDKWMAGFGLNYENVKVGTTHINDYLLRHNSYFTIANVKQKFYINITAGVFLGLEKLYGYTNEDKTFDFPETYKFLYGASVGGNFELFINNKTSITLTGEQLCNPNSPLGIWKYNILGGIRIYFSK